MRIRTHLTAGAACYTVASGDNLSKIARRFYGNDRRNTVLTLYYANLSGIGPNMNLIRPGQKLYIPDL